MGTKGWRQVNPLLVSGVASIVLCGLLVLQQLLPLNIASLWRSWLVLPLVLG